MITRAQRETLWRLFLQTKYARLKPRMLFYRAFRRQVMTLGADYGNNLLLHTDSDLIYIESDGGLLYESKYQEE